MLKRTKTALVAGVSVLALAGVGSGVAFAADTTPSTPSPSAGAAPSTSAPSSSSGSQNKGSQANGNQAKNGQAKGKKAKAHRLLARAEHAEATLRTKTGTQVVDLQRGAVTAVSPTSITVKSNDGFTATYVVNSDTKITKAKQKSAIGDVATNDTVEIIAQKSGTTTTARRIADPTKQH